MRYQVSYWLASACTFYSIIAGALGTAFCMMSMNPFVFLTILMVIYGRATFKFNRYTGSETIKFYTYYKVDRSVPKLKHSNARTLKRKCKSLGALSMLIIVFTVVFSVLILSGDNEPIITEDGVEVHRENILWLFAPLVVVLYGGQAFYCRMVYRSLE